MIQLHHQLIARHPANVVRFRDRSVLRPNGRCGWTEVGEPLSQSALAAPDLILGSWKLAVHPWLDAGHPIIRTLSPCFTGTRSDPGDATGSRRFEHVDPVALDVVLGARMLR